MREANPIKHGTGFAWTAEEDEALRKGRRKHDTDWKMIYETENEVLKNHSLNACIKRYSISKK